MREFGSRTKKALQYEKKEFIELLIASVVGGFAFSFDKWGYVNFNPYVGFFNLLTYSVYVFITLLAIDVGRKIYAGHVGIQATFHLSKIGALLAVGFAFVSNGAAAILFLSGFSMKPIVMHQLGRKQQFFKIRDGSWIAFYGCFGAFAVAILFSLLSVPISHLSELVKVNVLVLIYHLIPIDVIAALFNFASGSDSKQSPLTLGSALFLGSRTVTVFTAAFLFLGYSAILVVGSLWFVFLTILLAGVITAVYYYHKEL